MNKKGLFRFIENPEGKLDGYIVSDRDCGAISIVVMEGALDFCPPDVVIPDSAPYVIIIPGNADLSGYCTQPGFKGILASFGKEILESIGKEVNGVECRKLGKEETGMIPIFFGIIKSNSARSKGRYGQLADFRLEQALALKLFL